MDARADCAVSSIDFHGWRAALLANGLVRVVAVPDIGGRLMAYDLGDYAYLYIDRGLAGKLFSAEENLGDGSMLSWKNYGGDKTWPAPQGWDGPHQWPGPPDPVLDTGRYRLDALAASGDEAWVRMVSPAGSSTGVQITREARLRRGSSRLQLRLTFANIANRPIRWSIWDVVQLRAERSGAGGHPVYNPACVVTAPLNPASRHARGYHVLFGDPANPQWQADPEAGLFYGQYRFEIGKVALDSRGGWIAFANTEDGYALAETFTVDPDGEYPDGGADVECWTVGRGQAAGLTYDETSGPFLMETEVLSPYRDLAPGQATGFDIEWGACRCSGPVVAVSEAGCVCSPLAAHVEGGRATVTGSFGVFDAGDLALAWTGGLDASPEALAPASPLEAIRLERSLAVPPGATGVRLEMALPNGRRHRLDACELKATI